MSLIELSFKHGQSVIDAQAHLDLAVAEIRRRFGILVQTVEWTADHREVKLTGPGAELDLKVDPLQIHVRGDLPGLKGFLGSPIVAGLKSLVQQAFQQRLPRSVESATTVKPTAGKS